MEPPQMLAAVDLGSNSFRMVIARVVGEELQILDRLREGVRLAAALDDEGRLGEEGMRRALACLKRFGQRLRDLPSDNVRAVGTNTLRRARNRDRFLARAERALGHPIEVVSGQEEARLIFLGVSHSVSSAARRRLVVDIGGGSTECIVGEAFEPERTESLYMGCVGYTQRYFPSGEIDADAMEAAEVAARLELRPIKKAFRRLGWETALGASGTIAAAATILRENAWSEAGITPRGLKKLRRAIVDAGHVDDLQLPGLSKDRARVLPGGIAILHAIVDTLEVEQMHVSSGAMREGVLYDLLGRIRHEDVRDRTIQRFVEQYHVDVDQAERVKTAALSLLDQASEVWKLDEPRSRALLGWAASLHEIGLAVAHGGYHKHGAYLIECSDMPGFSYQDQEALALLVRSHRRKIRKSLFKGLPERRRESLVRLTALLRLAFLLNRSRSHHPPVPVRLDVRGKHDHKLRLSFPGDWLEIHPLTRADLDQEAGYLRNAGLKLSFEGVEALDPPG